MCRSKRVMKRHESLTQKMLLWDLLLLLQKNLAMSSANWQPVTVLQEQSHLQMEIKKKGQD